MVKATGGIRGGHENPLGKSVFKVKTADGYKTREEIAAKAGGVLHKSEVLYEFGDTYEGGDAWAGSGTSIFDPVLCELSYRWFCPGGGVILDPFAGGSVRGIVASKLGYRYHGIDLSGRQIAANQAQAEKICANEEHMPVWVQGSSVDTEQLYPDLIGQVDMIFSCPPYADLEVYSDHPDDLSNMPYEQFHEMYREIINGCVRMLKQDRFAVFVVGDIRDKEGNYRNFPAHTIQAFIDAGCGYYNEALLVTAVGSLPVRVGRQFKASRKLGKTHQNVFTFIKGDGKRAASFIE